MGPAKQFKNMMTGGRWLASIVYLASIVATLAVAFSVKGLVGGILCIVFIVVQFLAMVWCVSDPLGPFWVRGSQGAARC
jgi:hypothetical protein